MKLTGIILVRPFANIVFDTVIDTAYTGDDVELLLNALGDYENYILISSSAVYPEYAPQPFEEYAHLSINKYWGKYGTDKIDAETVFAKTKSKRIYS